METIASISSLRPRWTDMISILGSSGNSAILLPIESAAPRRPELPVELLHGRDQRLHGRNVHKVEGQLVVDAHRLQTQHHARRVGPLDLGHVGGQHLVPFLCTGGDTSPDWFGWLDPPSAWPEAVRWESPPAG